MTSFHFSGQRLDRDLVSIISTLLYEADIPNLLVGKYLQSLYGVPTAIDGVEYAVPDAAIDRSYKILANVGFLRCSQRSKCGFSNTKFSPQSSAHLHIDDELAILLHRQSDILWDFPPLDFKLIDDHHRREPDDARSDQVWCAFDSQLTTQRQSRSDLFLSDLQQQTCFVHIPSAARYYEALILLMCRDFMIPRKLHWRSHLSYYFDYIDGTNMFKEDDLRDGYREVYHALKVGEEKRRVILKDFRLYLKRRGLLNLKET